MELIKKNICFYDLVLDKRSIYEENADLVVPDTFPDVLRVISAEGTIKISDRVLQNDRILISGIIKIKVLYISENDSLIRCVQVPISFAHIEDLCVASETGEIFASAKTVKINAKLVNSRKISVSANMEIATKCYIPQNLSITENIETSSDGLELLKENHKFTLPSDVKRKSFTVFEEVDLSSTNVFEVINCKSSLKLTDKKIMQGKLLIRGEILVNSLVLTDENILKRIQNTLSFNQIFDVEGLSEDLNVHVELISDGIEFELTNGIFSLGFTVDCAIRVYELMELCEISDLYNTKYDILATTEKKSFMGYNTFENISKEYNEVITSGMRIENIISSSAEIESIIYDIEHMVINVFAEILYASDDNEVYSVCRILTVKFDNMDENFVITDMNVSATSSIIGEDGINIRLLINCEKFSTQNISVTDILDLELLSEKKRNPKLALLLKYVQNPMSVWEIAKQNNTGVTAIYEANNLKPEQSIIKDRMIIIPIK